MFATVLDPARYHGFGKRAPFFEGWYFKLVDAGERHRWAVIPGVFIGDEPHAFIQVLDGNTARSRYFRFDPGMFTASRDAFAIAIGRNEFSAEGLRLDIDDPDGRISGEVSFEGMTPWPVTLFSPGAMGWYAWVPMMQCYHGVLSMDHALRGSLEIDGETIVFSGGRGYAEKDWGKSFPRGYVWFQSNHFAEAGTSLTGSAAVIPWAGRAFRGFIIGLLHEGRLYRFATHTGAVIERLEISRRKVGLSVRDRQHRLKVEAGRAEGGMLHEPVGASMQRRVEETMLAELEVELSGPGGRVLFSGTGRNAGLEVHGDLDRLLSLK